MSASATLAYLNQMDEKFGTTNGFEGNAELRWTHRQTTVYLRVRESVLLETVQDSNFQTLFMGLRREF